jgi:hypothetical protein
MTLDEAVGDSENLTDFLLDFEEEWNAFLWSVRYKRYTAVVDILSML